MNKSYKIIDLSLPVMKNSSEPISFEHIKLNGKNGVEYISQKSGISKEAFPDNQFITMDEYHIKTHMGTHIDSPSHYGASEVSGNVNYKTVSDLPLEWFFGEAVKLDFSSFPRKKNIMLSDFVNQEKKQKLKITPGTIVLLRTGMDRYFGKKEYFTDGPGVSKEVIEYLVEEKKVKVIGIDSYGVDRSFPVMIDEYKKTGNIDVLWPAHMIGRKHEYVQVERLCNLKLIPDSNFFVSLFPIKLQNADASWIRAVAIVKENK
ncbi:cyclase family protein [Ligilactobacillus hohenheimensis]|uniref:cyclase family protein n=1 Tax=Ligilactobacillus hohenheimensis TaxID=2991832 RepID=UPI0024B97311|nr:cyclase family protein [Ligilactobacillus hohenheimensis]